MDAKGNPVNVTNKFTTEDTVYFSAKLTVPEGLEEAQYGVTIHVDGADIMEMKAKFDVKK